MKKMMKKWLPLLLVFTMLAGLLSGCGNAKQTANAADIDDGIKKPEFQRVPVDYTECDAEFYEFPAREVAEFSAMSRDLFDRDLFCSIVAEMQELGAKEGNLNKLKGLWNALIDAHDQVNTAYTLQNIKYYQDNSDENGDALTQLELELTEVADYMCLVLQKLLQSDLYGAAMQDYINSELVVDDILNYNAMTERAFELQEEKSNLVQEYYSLYYSEDDVSEDLAD
ncbi:MAG: hypothetical protein MJ135_03465, partial [Oscillospiraceae bacterium]|nr:hypothetical protein [Oscillospiraceae bacterium]